MEKYDVYYDSAVDDIEYQPSNDGSWYQVKDVEPILNSLQQLKAEIAALIEWCEDKDTLHFGMHKIDLLDKLRQLSAI